MARILIVDDEPDLVLYLSSELELAGWETASAPDGVAAVLKVQDGGWEACLMDMRMPRLDGMGALRIIHRLDPNLPVILFTGQANKRDLERLIEMGAYACLPKPVMIEKVIAVLQQAIQEQKKAG